MSEWRVLIEENVGGFGDRKEWRISDIYEVEGGREEARSIAGELAMRHTPKNPALLRERAVYRVNEDSWITMLIGVSTRYHYRVTVAELFFRG
ncbi:hypothetical protein [Microbispora sp. NPDC049125]|uniref:hypothetical protein n=1 Tax=Microbispora sp. NPDC049125 TaxID=3154929 RepID=UPI0034652BBF